MRGEKSIRESCKMIKKYNMIVSDLIKTFCKEISIFKITEKRQVEDNTYCQKQFAAYMRS
jgi:hypothetical protein